jgi:thiamine pyrophosphate-dependent acetolactate synthase large subunit-like protein
MVRLITSLFVFGALLVAAGQAVHSSTTLATGVLACVPGLASVIRVPASGRRTFFGSAVAIGFALAVAVAAHHGAPIHPVAAACTVVAR